MTTIIYLTTCQDSGSDGRGRYSRGMHFRTMKRKNCMTSIFWWCGCRVHGGDMEAKKHLTRSFILPFLLWPNYILLLWRWLWTLNTGVWTYMEQKYWWRPENTCLHPSTRGIEHSGSVAWVDSSINTYGRDKHSCRSDHILLYYDTTTAHHATYIPVDADTSNEKFFINDKVEQSDPQLWPNHNSSSVIPDETESWIIGDHQHQHKCNILHLHFEQFLALWLASMPCISSHRRLKVHLVKKVQNRFQPPFKNTNITQYI